MLTKNSHAQLLRQLSLALGDIKSQGFHGSGGNSFDDAVASLLVKRINAAGGYACEDGKKHAFVMVSPGEFKNSHAEMKRESQQQGRAGCSSFHFSEEALTAGDLLVVRQPNGTQNWPDLLVVANGVGLPFEIKSSKSDKIVWNGGLPRPARLYIFNYYDQIGPSTTFVMGDAIISQDEVDALKSFHDELDKLAKKFNKKMAEAHQKKATDLGVDSTGLRPAPWTYYPRAMYDQNEHFFDTKAITNEREEEARVFIKSFTFVPTSVVKLPAVPEKPARPSVPRG